MKNKKYVRKQDLKLAFIASIAESSLTDFYGLGFNLQIHKRQIEAVKEFWGLRLKRYRHQRQRHLTRGHKRQLLAKTERNSKDKFDPFQGYK